ncbi:MAG TPA: hypothetical protein PLR20_02675 [Syntrophales bacterium]|jgi:hypothetical protein|nr:hypothetical protein [Syntrophales bacterium]HOX93776.1 hypothetical protein [Syntrophales bacterium]HPI57725.1 hypothetical protein [Syntrophales bacterium]HPN23958.1 hypothetical protein [Syntrophales bacterium]HQM28237.1 hypothetical protein [Syntrophales bacterium]
MPVDKSRRSFFTRDLLGAGVKLFEELTGSNETEAPKRDYFESFESCYPLLSEAGEMLIEEAVRRGIRVEGRSREEIARDIFAQMEKA